MTTQESIQGISLNEAQLRAVTTKSKTVLCLAGPGSGKTRTLVERIRYLSDCYPMSAVDPQRIAAITFTNNAASEMRSRLDGIALGFVGTLHSFLLRLIQQHASKLGYSSARLTVLTEDQAKAELEKAATDVMYRGSKEKLTEALHSVLRVQVQRNGYDVAKVAATRFVSNLRRNNLLTFDTILFEGLRLLGVGVEVPFDHLLVDEHQDTSDLDAEIYRALCIPNKFFVGDPDQSIYKFRGGSVANILGLAQLPGVEVITLSDNYRCGQAICDAANRLIRHNQGRVDKETRSATGTIGDVDVQEYQTAAAEFRGVSHQILNRRDDGQSIAVLLRTNVLVDQWTDYLMETGIPVARRASVRRPADWRKAIATVAFLSDPLNDWSAYQFISEWNGDEGAANRQQTAARAAGKPLSEFARLDIAPGLTIAAYSQACARIGVSQESCQLIDEASCDLPPGATPADLLLALNAPDEDRQDVGEGVFVGTYHSAKGREWDCVALPCFEDGIIPGKAASADIEENRRLAYVGFTRARHQLLISYCRERRLPFSTQTTPAEPSRFLREAGLL